MQAWRIHVRGIVQGVGFRPHVWRLAAQFGLTGSVLNDPTGVVIELFCDAKTREEFEIEMRRTAPLLARIDAVEFEKLDALALGDFRIIASKSGKVVTGITPDAATCAECFSDVMSPENRRYRYAFANCTHCGPRLSIIQKIPYDRANTAMAKFAMCAKCQAEYDDPANRRYHAQPNACPDCGPVLALLDNTGAPVQGDAIETTASLLNAGKIVAIKGLGGFQLAADAQNSGAIASLRQRKHRSGKPLALMVRDVEMAGKVAHLTPEGAALLQSWQAPIVLLDSKFTVASEVAPAQPRIGVMLPNTPLHHLLLHAVNQPIVLTSGNLVGDPQIIDNNVALAKLAPIADYFLMHDRDIINRVDDSVVQITVKGPQIIRRARGYAPAPIVMPESFNGLPATLAIGGDMKNTFCLLGQGRGVISQHMGDMGNPATQRDFRANLALYQQLYDFTPERVVVDQHPSYFSSRLGEAISAERGVELLRVQHHHAHVVSVMAEHGVPCDAAPVLGIVLDGSGYGSDGTIWGGEFLRVDYKTSARLVHFPKVALLGGDKANHQPWRNLYAHLCAAFGPKGDWMSEFAALPALGLLEAKPLNLLDQMLANGLNSPLSSSAGRLFDAVAAILGVNFESTSFEGEAAMKVQAMAECAPDEKRHYFLETDNLDSWKGLWCGILTDRAAGYPNNTIAKKFHNTLEKTIVQKASALIGQEGFEHVVLSGGVFQNRLLLASLEKTLGELGANVLVPENLPANDGGLSFGQAVIGALR